MKHTPSDGDVALGNDPAGAPPRDNRLGREVLAQSTGACPAFTEEVNNHDNHERPTEDASDVAIGTTPICDRCGLPRFGGSCVHCDLTGLWRWPQISGSGARKR